MKVVVTKSRMRGLVQEDKVCSTHCIASFSPRCGSFTQFDGSVRLHRGEPVSEGIHYSLVWFSVNERYLRQLNEDLRKELIACGFPHRGAPACALCDKLLQHPAKLTTVLRGLTEYIP